VRRGRSEEEEEWGDAVAYLREVFLGYSKKCRGITEGVPFVRYISSS
jgi:hypothetical protein